MQVPLPDLQNRVDILNRLAKQIPLSKSVNIEDIASMTERFSGADIAALLRQSATFVLKDYRRARDLQSRAATASGQQQKQLVCVSLEVLYRLTNMLLLTSL